MKQFLLLLIGAITPLFAATSPSADRAPDTFSFKQTEKHQLSSTKKAPLKVAETIVAIAIGVLVSCSNTGNEAQDSSTT